MDIVPFRNRGPWRSLSNLQEELDRFASPFFSGGLMPSLRGEKFSPAMDMWEDANNIHIEANLPGMEQKDINVKVIGNTLELSGKREEVVEQKDKDYYCCERFRGSFFRAIDLPSSANTDKIEAKTKNGVLTINIPKKEEEKAKEIKVRVD